MENEILTTVLITILSVGALSTLVYLVSTVRNLKDKVGSLSLEIGGVYTEMNHNVREQEVELNNVLKDLDTRFDRVHRKMNKKEEDVFRAMQEQVELIKNANDPKSYSRN
tara:strand:- start:266 stop:595 length:330 start_codon:yes stop_codon:yes gene_type:complete